MSCDVLSDTRIDGHNPGNIPSWREDFASECSTLVLVILDILHTPNIVLQTITEPVPEKGSTTQLYSYSSLSSFFEVLERIICSACSTLSRILSMRGKNNYDQYFEWDGRAGGAEGRYCERITMRL